MKSVYLSVVIPVYNETARLYNLVAVVEYLKKQKYSFELLVVNDGSTDRTLANLKRLAGKHGFKIVTYRNNRGKGWAIKQGMLLAQGSQRIFMDVDLSTPIDQLEKFIPVLGKQDVIIGTRKNNRAKVLVRQPLVREYMGKGFTWLSQQLLQVPVSDFTCGFKCFSAPAAEKIFTQMKVERWGFDPEILYLAQKYKFRIKEVPVVWTNDSQTKVRFPQDIINSFGELLAVLVNDKLKRAYR
jgi:dolichyl-phosphate beta-glucosyltransferase